MNREAQRQGSHKSSSKSKIGNLLLVSSILITSLNVIPGGSVALPAAEASAGTTMQPSKTTGQRVADATIQGHVSWQGRPAPPDDSLSLPLTLTLLLQGGYSAD